MIHPLDRSKSHPDTAKLAQAEHKRSLSPDRILLNSYLPPRRPASVMEEVTVPGPEDIKRIIHRWKPFNSGESTTDRLGDLYLRTLRMPVTARAIRLGKEYSVVIPVGTTKEDIQQIVEAGIQTRNQNYVQLTELVK